jgi:hypothetical protein
MVGQQLLFLKKKQPKKLLILSAFELPYCGRATAGGSKSFLRLFFRKEVLSSSCQPQRPVS